MALNKNGVIDGTGDALDSANSSLDGAAALDPFVALDGLIFDEATDRAAEALFAKRAATGEAAIGRAERAAAQERAREILGKAGAANGEGPLAGIQDMHNLSLAIGLPAPRILFDAMVDAAAATNKEKKVWRRQLMRMSEVQETGCIKVDFAGKKGSAYLVLDECGPGHNLTAQLNKLYARVPNERRGEILNHLSALVHLGRAAYSQMMVQMMPTLEAIGKKIRVAGAFDPRLLGVDPANTTLYVPHTGNRRVGIFVRLSSEIGDAAPPAAQKSS